MNFDNVMKRIMGLSALKFFPTETSGHLAIAEIVGNMAKSEDQVKWLVDRMLVLYSEWPGPREMRVVFCAKFKPADGIEARGSDVFDGGIIPPERIEQAPRLALPQGDPFVNDEAEAEDLRGKLQAILDRQKKQRRPLGTVSPISASAPLITQADVDREIEKLREAKARFELMDSDEKPSA